MASQNHGCDCESCKELKELLLVWWRIKAVFHSIKWLSGVVGTLAVFYAFYQLFNGV